MKRIFPSGFSICWYNTHLGVFHATSHLRSFRVPFKILRRSGDNTRQQILYKKYRTLWFECLSNSTQQNIKQKRRTKLKLLNCSQAKVVEVFIAQRPVSPNQKPLPE